MHDLHRTLGHAHATLAWRLSAPTRAPRAALPERTARAARLADARGAGVRATRGIRVRDARGQGTVEYVALMLLVATILTAVVAASGKVGDDGIGKLVVGKLKDAIDGVGAAKGKG